MITIRIILIMIHTWHVARKGIPIMMTAIQFWGHDCRCKFYQALFLKTFHFSVHSCKSEARDKWFSLVLVSAVIEHTLTEMHEHAVTVYELQQWYSSCMEPQGPASTFTFFTETDKHNSENFQMQVSFSSSLVCIISMSLVSL